jgi:hypothetical protein
MAYALIFCSATLVIFSPWAIRNTVWTGNPAYPLFRNLFNPPQLPQHNQNVISGVSVENQPLNGNKKTAWGNFAVRKHVYQENLAQIISMPIRIFFQGQDDNPKYFDGQLNPYLFLLPFLAFVGFKRLSRRRQRENLALLSFSVLFLLYTFLQIDMRIRYIAPIIPPLVMLSVIGLYQTSTWIQHKWNPAGRRVGFGLVVILVMGLLSLNARYLVKQFRYVDPISYLSGQIGRDDYIKKYRKEYPAIQFINTHLPPDSRVLAIYLGRRIYYSDRQMVSNDGLLKRSIADSSSADALADTLRAEDFSHLLLRSDFFKYFIFDYLSNEKRIMFNRFLKTRTKWLFTEGVFHVYEITDARSTPLAKNNSIQQ